MSPTVRISCASSSEMVIPNFSSTAITSSTLSRPIGQTSGLSILDRIFKLTNVETRPSHHFALFVRPRRGQLVQWGFNNSVADIILRTNRGSVWMRVSYTLTERDVLEAQGKHGGLWIKVLPIIGVLVLVASLVSLVHNPKQFPSFVGGIVVGLFLMFFRRLQVWLSFRRDNRLQDQFGAAISDSGIDVSSSKADSKYDWSAFVRYAETKNLFL